MSDCPVVVGTAGHVWGQHIVFNCAFVELGITDLILERKLRRETRERWNVMGRQPDVKM